MLIFDYMAVIAIIIMVIIMMLMIKAEVFTFQSVFRFCSSTDQYFHL